MVHLQLMDLLNHLRKERTEMVMDHPIKMERKERKKMTMMMMINLKERN